MADVAYSHHFASWIEWTKDKTLSFINHILPFIAFNTVVVVDSLAGPFSSLICSDNICLVFTPKQQEHIGLHACFSLHWKVKLFQKKIMKICNSLKSSTLEFCRFELWTFPTWARSRHRTDVGLMNDEQTTLRQIQTTTYTYVYTYD